jgi:hypothetical protein
MFQIQMIRNQWKTINTFGKAMDTTNSISMSQVKDFTLNMVMMKAHIVIVGQYYQALH